MHNLRELTKEKHKEAENTRFIQSLIKKEMTDYEYYVYLMNQIQTYMYLERYAMEAGVLSGIESICRGYSISKDLHELEKSNNFSAPVSISLNSTIEYVKYLSSIREDGSKLLAHIYVRHMGDLYGGQIIKKFVPGSGNFYVFDEDINVLKEKLSSKLNDSMEKEANKCFEMIIKFLKEIKN